MLGGKCFACIGERKKVKVWAVESGGGSSGSSGSIPQPRAENAIDNRQTPTVNSGKPSGNKTHQTHQTHRIEAYEPTDPNAQFVESDPFAGDDWTKYP